MLVRIDPEAADPLFAQIADSIRTQIAQGTLGAGTRLPPARDLAVQLDVNVHTVLKAYQELRDEGLVQVRRGRGTQITDKAGALQDLAQDAESLRRRAEGLGVSTHSLVAILRGG